MEPPSVPNSRTRTAILVALLPLLLVLGLWFGGHPNDLPGFLRDAFVAERQTHVVDEAIERIAHDYYRPIPVDKLADASISGVVASLGDRFSHYLSPSEFREFNAPPHFAGIGVSIEPERHGTTVRRGGLLIARVFDATPAARAGLKAGDLIVTVDGRRLQGLSEEAAANLIRGRPGTSVELRVRSAHTQGQSGQHAMRDLEITRALISTPVVASERKTVEGKKLGIVALATFTTGAHGEVRRAVEQELHHGARGLVFDLRSNGGGLVSEAQLIASIFIAKGTIVTTRGRTQPTQTLLALGDAIPTSIPMVVLVDQNTASAAEIVTAALQDHHRATVVGTHTFGKGVFQEEEPLSNGGALDITVGEYFTPDGRNLGGGGVKEGAGIMPEVEMGKAVDGPRGLSVALRTLAAKVK
jgi:carboxyl-terminal processing protease